MPNPLPSAQKTAQIAVGTHAFGIPAIWDVPNGKILSIQGIPAAIKGSIIYGHAVSFGYILTDGLITANRGRKGLRRTSRGGEDGRQSQG